jgi:hydroxylaminobenzene mutase
MLLERQSHRLMQVGASLFLFALVVGFFVPQFALPRMALSVHLIAISRGLFLMVAGLVWPRLGASAGMLRATYWLLLYGCFAGLGANLLAASWDAGQTLLPVAAGEAHGSPWEEQVIGIVLRSGGAALILGTALFIWGLRRGPASRQP